MHKIDPLEFFASISGIPSVTFNEYYMYEFLVRRWMGIRSEMREAQRKKLSIEFREGSQLAVRWQGAPKRQRNMVLVAHVDKEGFLIERFDPNEKYCYGFPVNDETDIGDSIVGSEVEIRSRFGKHDATVKSVKHAERLCIVEFEVTASHQEESLFVSNEAFAAFAQYKLRPYEVDDEGVIASPCVDNYVGVSLVSSVLEGVCAANWAVNVEALFTTCEEGGFCGIVKHILAAPERFTDEQTTWIVVDSSSKNSGYVESTPADLRLPYSQLENRKISGIDLRQLVVRTGDKRTVFSREVSHMLHVSSWNALRKVGVFKADSEKCKLKNEFVFCSDSVVRNVRQEEGCVIGARMVGGWCDASPIHLAPHLLDLDPAGNDWYRPRVGAIAIPIGNYRNNFQGRPAQEICHAAAVSLALVVLAEAAKANMRYNYIGRPRSQEDVGLLREAESEHVDMIKQWLAFSERYLRITDSWVKERVPKLFGGPVGFAQA